jgi:type IV secretory pathway VirB6-like protein
MEFFYGPRVPLSIQRLLRRTLVRSCRYGTFDEWLKVVANATYLQPMKKVAFLLLLFCCVQCAVAQTAEDSVKAVINKLFTAMKASDSKALQECFADGAILQTITRTGNIQTEDIKEFAAQIGKLPKDSADEQIVFETLKVDASLAIAWTPYRFYYAGKFSHCGVDSFQLVRINGIWKIQYLIDTRRRADCQ